MTELLRDLIAIPEAVHKGDFVMHLAEGVTEPERTLRDYVVTDQLARAYDDALGFIASAIREDRSKATYLDGSFGSGKSHFMAVLDLLLLRHPDARAIPELAEAIARHDPVLADKQIEVVPLHMIGPETLEQKLFGGYLRHLQRTDPDAPLPGVFADAPVFAQADLERQRGGHGDFFAALNAGADAGGGWGALEAEWNATSYEEAKRAPVDDPRRRRLAGTVVKHLMPGYGSTLTQSGYVDIDTGLAELARNAQARGKDALVLFLDELILWLASYIGNQEYVTTEWQKCVKLIEHSTKRPIPIVAFAARQRDLREFVGDLVSGAEREVLADMLKYWEGRFHSIKLADRNLPKIASRRLLRPKDEAARQTLDAAFRDVERTRPDVLAVLLTATGDREQFRETYPFSPAFMDTLVAASSALQRERTALKVMLQLLVDRRDELTVGDVVSVGDLFDVLAHGDEPFSADMRRHFDHARRLYREQFLPLLLAEHGLDERELAALPANHGFRADDRLVKTLLLAALVPQTASLRDLDIARLTALNHGSISSPIPGAERGHVLGRLKKWAAQVGALRLGEDPQNPTVSLRLTGVDVDGILLKADSVDNPAVRRQLVRRLLFADLGIDTEDRLFADTHTVLWRGTRRSIDVVFGNVRDAGDITDDALQAREDRWKVVIDYPFDPGHAPGEDLDRLDRWRADHGPTRTVAWIPAFFSAPLQRDVKRLVLVDHVLEGERLNQYGDHLSAQDRAQARGILADMRSALVERVRSALRQAYGVERGTPDAIDLSHGVEDRLQSLWPSLRPQVPVGARLEDAFAGLAAQMLDEQYPAHPRFEEEVRLRDLRIVDEEVLRAIDHPDGRSEVIGTDRRRAMRRIATPLQLGVQHEAPFVLGTHWKEHLDRHVALARRESRETITVGDLRRWIDEPQPLGLTREVGSLVILVYAAQTRHAFHLRGGPAPAVDIDRLDDTLELVAAELPDEAAWRTSLKRAASVLGLASVNEAYTSASVETLAGAVREAVAPQATDAAALVAAVEGRLEQMGAAGTAPRAVTARAARALADAVTAAESSVAVIERFATIEPDASNQAVGTSLRSAGALVRALADERWQVLDLAVRRAAEEPAFRRIVDELRTALERDEFAEPLEPAIARAYRDAVALISETSAEPRPPEPEPMPPPDGRSGAIRGVSVAEAQAKLDELGAANGRVTVDLSWTITEP